MHLIQLAFRNIFRNKRRSFLAILSILLSMFAITVLHGFADGFLVSIVKNYTKNDSGHVRISSSKFAEKTNFMSVQDLVPDYKNIIALIENNKEIMQGVDTITERAYFGVLLNNEARTKSALAIAGESKTEESLLMLQKAILPGGTYLAKANETIVGEGLAKTLGLNIGDTLKVVTQTSEFGTNMKKFKISGIFKTNVNSLDNNVFQVHIEDARKLLKLGESAQGIYIMLKNYREAEVYENKILNLLRENNMSSGIAVQNWNKIGEYPKMVATLEGLYGWIYAAVLFLGAFIISNIMMMVILERKKEIGLLKAMGLKRRELLFLFTLEGTSLGVIGSVLGLIFGLLFNFIFSFTGYDLTSLMSSFNYPMDSVIRPTFSISAILGLLFLGVIISVCVSFFPSRRAAKMNAIDAIRSV